MPKKRTITKLALAFTLVCLLTITPQPVFSQYYIDQLYQQGLAAYNRGDFLSAESTFRYIISIYPNYTLAYYNLGNAFREQGKLDAAVINYQQAIRLNPNYAAAYGNLGIALWNQGKLEEAIANYQQAIQLDPNRAASYYSLGIALYDQGKIDAAIANYQRAIQLDPNYVKAYISLGNARSDQGKIDAAITSYQKAIELNPNLAGNFLNLGNALSKQGKLDAAIYNYQKALSLPNHENGTNPSSAHVVAYNNLGIALYDQRKIDAAIANYQQAIQLDPNYAPSYNNLGIVLEQKDNLEEAIKNFQLALEVDPKLLIAQNNLREAERRLAIKLNPTSPNIDDTKFLPSLAEEPLVNTMRSTARIVSQISAEGVSIGAGWVVKKEDNTVWIVTNRHVVSDPKTKIPSKKIEVEFFSELSDAERPRYEATIIHSTERNDALDLAVLEVTDIPYDIQALPVGSGRVPRNASTLIIGHPHTIDDPWSVSSGEVFNFNPNNPIMSIDANVAQGNSGGPVVDSNNQVIGMMHSLRTNGDVATNPDQAFPNDINRPLA